MSSDTPPAPTDVTAGVRPPVDRMTPGARRALVASTAGTLIEWYDYALYGAAAGLVIGPLFFPGSIPGAADMLAFATFAVGFLVRPLGGLLIAHFGDRFGRKPALLLTIVLITAVLMLIVSAIMWAIAAANGNYSAAAKGRTGVLVALGTAVLAGAGVAWLNWLIDLGQQL